MQYQVQNWLEHAELKRTKYFRDYRRKKRGSVREHLSGSVGEFIALNLLCNSKLVRKATHDLEWYGKKIEVKTAIIKNEKSPTWSFQLREKQINKSHFLLLICLDKNKELVKFYLLPDGEVSSRDIWIGPKTEKVFNKFMFNGR